jgi:hypothetical protein
MNDITNKKKTLTKHASGSTGNPILRDTTGD